MSYQTRGGEVDALVTTALDVLTRLLVHGGQKEIEGNARFSHVLITRHAPCHVGETREKAGHHFEYVGSCLEAPDIGGVIRGRRLKHRRYSLQVVCIRVRYIRFGTFDAGLIVHGPPGSLPAQTRARVKHDEQIAYFLQTVQVHRLQRRQSTSITGAK